MKRAQIPPKVLEDENPLEILSLWIAGGKSHVSMNTNWSMGQADGERIKEEAWGILLADLALHMANAVSQDTGYPKEYVLQRIRETFDKDLNESDLHIEGSLTN